MRKSDARPGSMSQAAAAQADAAAAARAMPAGPHKPGAEPAPSRRARRLRRPAFTLVEILVVAALVSFLAMLGAVSINSASKNYRLEFEARRLETLLRTAREWAYSRSQYEPCGIGVRFFSGYAYTIYTPSDVPGNEPPLESCPPQVLVPNGGPPNETMWGFQNLGTSYRGNGQAQLDVGLTQPANGLGSNLVERDILIYFTDDPEIQLWVPNNSLNDRVLFYRPTVTGTNGWTNSGPVFPHYNMGQTRINGNPLPWPLNRIRLDLISPQTGAYLGSRVRLRIDPDTAMVRRMNSWEP